MSIPVTLKPGQLLHDETHIARRFNRVRMKTATEKHMDFTALIASAKQNSDGSGLPPVDKWHPEYCGDMDLIIKSDGSWWHDGSRITRAPLIKLFSTILRKDEDGETYLVTPGEKIKIKVERGHFLATRVDIEGAGQDQRVFFKTDQNETVELSAERPLRVQTDPKTLEPEPYIGVRGRLEAALTRAVFYELVDHAVERETPEGPQLGLYARGKFFPLGPAGAHTL